MLDAESHYACLERLLHEEDVKRESRDQARRHREVNDVGGTLSLQEGFEHCDSGKVAFLDKLMSLTGLSIRCKILHSATSTIFLS